MNAEIRALSEAMKDQADDEFHQYGLFIPELRKHMLKFADNKTLWNYAQCSRKCNNEIQEFNKKAPTQVLIREMSNGVGVYCSYAKSGTSLNEPLRPYTFTNFVSNDETMECVENHLKKTYRYVKDRETLQLSIDLKNWPVKLLESGIFSKVIQLDVYVHNGMLKKFVEFAKSNKVQVRQLELIDSSAGNTATIDKQKLKQLFKTSFFQRMRLLSIRSSCPIDDEDFLSFKNVYINLKLTQRLITDNAIRQKVAELNGSTRYRSISLEIPPTDPHQFDYGAMFPQHYNPFEFNGYLNDDLDIGNVDIFPFGTTYHLNMCRRRKRAAVLDDNA